MGSSTRIGLVLLFVAQLSSIGFAQSGIITTYAGPGLPVNGALATSQAIDNPQSVAPDGTGGFYLVSPPQGRVYRVTADGRLSLIVGSGTQGFSGDGGPASSAQLNNPFSAAADVAGNLFIADSGNNCVRKVTPGGVISTVAGNGTQGFSGDGGPATSAQLNNPSGIAVDAAGNLFIADIDNSRIRKVTPGGIISTVAGDGTRGFSGDGGPATSAQFYSPSGVAVDTAGNLFIADFYNYRVRKVTPGGGISTVAGGGAQGLGDGGPATSAELYDPSGVAVDTAGNLFIADSDNQRVRKVTPGGVISTVAGNGSRSFGGDGGPGTSAQLDDPSGVAADTAGNLFIADNGNSRVRKVRPGGVISTVAGNGTMGFSGDGGTATSAQLFRPYGVAADTAGNLYIADTDNSRIRKVTPGGVISTVAGSETRGVSGDGGPATSAQLNNPLGVAVDVAGNLFIADSNNSRIRKVTPSGVISTVAGGGAQGLGDGGPATAAQLNLPSAVAVDTAGNLFIADYYNQRVRKVTPGGVISTVAGNGTRGFRGDGGPATSAEFYDPSGVAVDAAGNLFIADFYNYRVRKVTAGGAISTVVGNGTFGLGGDGGPATSAQLNAASGVAMDAAGNLFIADGNRIRKVTPGGVISTVAGNVTIGFSGDGSPATSAQLNNPFSVAVDEAGNLFIVDTFNDRVRKVTSVASATTFFPQVAVGNGWDTLFTVTNTGSTAASGNLTLTDPQGNPIAVSGVVTDSSGTTQSAISGSSFALTVPAGGTVFLSVNALNPNDPTTKFGWAQLVGTGGSLSGVATYELVVGGIVQSGVGVLQSHLLQFASIPVDNDTAQDQKLAYAIANPSSQAISVRMALVGQDGTVVDDTVTLTLVPGQQIARYLWQDLPARANFKGSLVLQGQAGASFIAVALIQKQGLYTVIPLISGNEASAPTFFPQVAFGDGWDTLFTVTNTGSTAATGNLVLTDPQGNPIWVSCAITNSSGTTQPAFPGYSFDFTVPAGGTVFLSANALNPNNPTQVGWAQLQGTGGSLTGVATYEHMVGGNVQNGVGVLQSQLLQIATIPVDNDSAQAKQLAYAVSNPGNQAISIRLALVSQDGTVVDDTINVPLTPGQQVATYLWQDLPARANFKGSLVLRGQAGASFIAVALLQKQGLYTVIPLIPAKAPGIPD